MNNRFFNTSSNNFITNNTSNIDFSKNNDVEMIFNGKSVRFLKNKKVFLEFFVDNFSGCVIQRDFAKYFDHSGVIIGRNTEGDLGVFSIYKNGIYLEYVSGIILKYPSYRIYKRTDSLSNIFSRMQMILKHFGCNENYDFVFKNCNYYSFLISENSKYTNLKNSIIFILVPLIFYFILKTINKN